MMSHDPYEQYPQNRPMPHPGAPKWEDLASQEFVETTEGDKEYWKKQAIMWKQNFGELRSELDNAEHELEARRQILDGAVKIKERLIANKIGNGWIDSIRFLGDEIEDTRARAESAESEVRTILQSLKTHCKDDFVVVIDGAIDWSRSLDEFVSFITTPLHDKYAHEGGKPQVMTTDILKRWVAAIDIPIMTDVYQTAVPNVFYATFALPLYSEHRDQLRALGIEVTDPNSQLRNRYMLKWIPPRNDEV